MAEHEVFSTPDGPILASGSPTDLSVVPVYPCSGSLMFVGTSKLASSDSFSIPKNGKDKFKKKKKAPAMEEFSSQPKRPKN